MPELLAVLAWKKANNHRLLARHALAGMEVQVGERLVVKDKDGQHYGTVLFVGSIHGKLETWVGVEWDEPSRGKHDGSVDGIQYFTCLHGGARGSFVKLGKIKPGISFGEAVRERYTPDVMDLSDMSIDTVGHKTLNVELAGTAQVTQRLHQLNLLQQAALDGMRISRPGDLASLQGLLTSLRHLGLANNLLGSWQHAHEILQALPSVVSADLSCNRLHWAERLPGCPPLAHIRTLVLNECRLTWQDAVDVAAVVPALAELYLGSNGIQSLTAMPVGRLAELQVLDLQDNALEGWEAVAALAELPRLRELKLTGNNIKSVRHTGFDSLEVLLLGRCGIAHLTAIDELDKFPRLKDVRLSENPFLLGSSVGGRFECIARLAKLTVLNGAAVSKRERRDSELRYLRAVSQKLAMLDVGKRAVEAAHHPRLEALVAEYGVAEVSGREHRAVDGVPMSHTLVAVRLTCAANSTAGDKVQDKRVSLPSSTTIGHVKLLCSALFDMDVNLQQLVLKGSSRAEDEDIGMDNTLDLQHFNIQDDAELQVGLQDADSVWARCADTQVADAPASWLLPVELRPELASLVN